MLPSAAAFVDPLFSTGFPMTLLGIERLGRLMEQGLFAGTHTADHAAGLEAYARDTVREGDHTARFIAGCYAAFPRFDVFAAYSMFYFAAASYAELRGGSVQAGRAGLSGRRARRFCRRADAPVAGSSSRRPIRSGTHGRSPTRSIR
jgi:hypothetical protein